MEGIKATWLRWATPDGALIPTAEEAEQSQRERAERAEHTIAELAARLVRYEQQIGAEPDHDAP